MSHNNGKNFKRAEARAAWCAMVGIAIGFWIGLDLGLVRGLSAMIVGAGMGVVLWMAVEVFLLKTDFNKDT